MSVTFILRCWIAVLCFGAFALEAAHTKARLVLDYETARPGDTVTAGLHLQMDAKWHTYWRNPGNAGLPTEINWKLPPGVTAGTTLWPVPEKLAEQELTTYIYEKEAVLLTPLKLAADLKPGPVEIQAAVSWLECAVQCVPGDANVSATLTVGGSTARSQSSELIAAWQKRLPAESRNIAAKAEWKAGATPESRTLFLEWNAGPGATSPDFYPYSSEEVEVQPATTVVSQANGRVRLSKEVKRLGATWPAAISGIVVQGAGEQRQAYELSVQPQLAGASPPPGGVDVLQGAAVSLWKMLLYAFIGGLILNIMPCVLPVIALKILGFVGQARSEPGRVRLLGLIYGAGVLVSFLVLAGLVIGVKAAGHQAGWGMQFGNPQFLVVLTVLVTLVALNLFGVFEITPGGRVMSAAGTLASRHGASGAFFNGVLATVLATPCTAPFLGVALGFAFAQSAPIIALIFLTVGLGLAAPYIVLSWNPGWLKFVPKPGPWMEKFKIAMGFPMLATAVWLFSLLPIHYGDRAWWLGIFLVVVGFAAWIYGQFLQQGVQHRGLALGAIAILLVGSYVFVVEGRLQWRKASAAEAQALTVASLGSGVEWKPWSRAAVVEARSAGKPVLVDFTAKWCLTCNTIVKPALESAAVQKKLKAVNAVALLADYTLLPSEMTAELNRYGRAGVPLVLVFPGNPNAPAIVLPEALTPGMVVEALDRAGT